MAKRANRRPKPADDPNYLKPADNPNLVKPADDPDSVKSADADLENEGY